MIVFDVVMHIEPGAITSVPVGRWSAGSCHSRPRAEEMAENYNHHVHADGIRCLVEMHDELCPGRARHYRDTEKAGECTCSQP